MLSQVFPTIRYGNSGRRISVGLNWLGNSWGRKWDLGQGFRRDHLNGDKVEWKLKSSSGRRKGMSTGVGVGMVTGYSEAEETSLAMDGYRALGGRRTM